MAVTLFKVMGGQKEMSWDPFKPILSHTITSFLYDAIAAIQTIICKGINLPDGFGAETIPSGLLSMQPGHASPVGASYLNRFDSLACLTQHLTSAQ